MVSNSLSIQIIHSLLGYQKLWFIPINIISHPPCATLHLLGGPYPNWAPLHQLSDAPPLSRSVDLKFPPAQGFLRGDGIARGGSFVGVGLVKLMTLGFGWFGSVGWCLDWIFSSYRKLIPNIFWGNFHVWIPQPPRGRMESPQTPMATPKKKILPEIQKTWGNW